MSDSFLPFSKPTVSEQAIREVEECLRSGWITTGPRVARFESQLAEYAGAESVQCCASATAGLLMALLALDLQPGDEVITTPMTFAATLNTIVLAGGRPVLVDIDRTTCNLDPEAVENALTPRTRAPARWSRYISRAPPSISTGSTTSRSLTICG